MAFLPYGYLYVQYKQDNSGIKAGEHPCHSETKQNEDFEFHRNGEEHGAISRVRLRILSEPWV